MNWLLIAWSAMTKAARWFIIRRVTGPAMRGATPEEQRAIDAVREVCAQRLGVKAGSRVVPAPPPPIGITAPAPPLPARKEDSNDRP